jgi:hypothetical protein
VALFNISYIIYVSKNQREPTLYVYYPVQVEGMVLPKNA